ncbi:hypothetical protein Dimus_027505 [Dionaea muscipula]
MSRYEQSLLHHSYRFQYYGCKDQPSFSSTLLESIYRSIDENSENRAKSNEKEEEVVHHQRVAADHQKHSNGRTMMTKSSSANACFERKKTWNAGKDRLIHQWMEKTVRREKILVRRVSTATGEDLDENSRWSDSRSLGPRFNFSSSSSESSAGGISSPNTKSYQGSLKPIRTAPQLNQFADHQKPKKHERGHGTKTTKSRATTIYNDPKKVKHPISPGGRLTTFLNSLFTAAGNARKLKISPPQTISGTAKTEEIEPKSPENSSTCSTASSFSRSCLSKTPSSAGRLEQNGGAKRSVRFFPVSVIIGEDSRPCGKKSLYGKEEASMVHFDDEFRARMREESRRIEEVARDLLKNYQNNERKFDNVDDDDDDESCCSSDLFELDNLFDIGVGRRYREELPVYETTHLDINRAIANGILV